MIELLEINFVSEKFTDLEKYGSSLIAKSLSSRNHVCLSFCVGIFYTLRNADSL